MKDEKCVRMGILACGPISQYAHLEAVQKGRNVAEVILNGGTMRGASIEDGVASARGMVAIAESVRTGEAVALANVSGAL